jgi:predicted DNA-binding protein (MmcQ/YjbR family)
LDPVIQHKSCLVREPLNRGVFTATDGLVPAPYAARFHWVAVTRPDALPAGVARQLIGESYKLVAAGLSAKVRKHLGL